MWRRARRRRRLSALVCGILGASLLAACGGGSAELSSDTTTTCASGSHTLVFWAWVPGLERVVSAYNNTHPDTCVELQNVGSGVNEYIKLNTASHAGAGAPDIAEVEYAALPGFEVTNQVANIERYLPRSASDRYLPALWQQVSRGSGVYGVPLDSGPTALIYNKKILASNGMRVPTTWADAAKDALLLHKKDPSVQMFNLPVSDSTALFPLMSQNGAVPFSWDGSDDVRISVDCAKCIMFARFWQKLIDAGAVALAPDNSATEFGLLDSGQVAAAPRAAWGPKYFVGAATKSVGQWQIAGLPQWRTGARIAPSWGGSSYVVSAQSKYPALAAKFLNWMTTTDQSWRTLITAPTLSFPADKRQLTRPGLLKITNPLTGKQPLQRQFASSARGLTTLRWPPFATYLLTATQDMGNEVVQHQATLPQALHELQKNLVDYAQREGFTVTT